MISPIADKAAAASVTLYVEVLVLCFLFVTLSQWDEILCKVQLLWEGHKIWKNLPPVLTKQLFLLRSFETSGRFFQIFVAFSEKLDFKIEKTI